MEEPKAKKHRGEKVSCEHLLIIGRLVMNRPPTGSIITEDPRFREHFGCGPAAAANAWNLIEEDKS
jgi:hypothetical protein